MTKQASYTKIQKVSHIINNVSYAAMQLELDPNEITPNSTFEDLGIDSLDIVEMIYSLESELGIELEMEDQKITTFGELAAFVESKVN